LTIDNAPDHNTRVIDRSKSCTTTTVTSSLLQKPVTIASGNQGSCDKNPGQEVTTEETGAIVRKNGGNKKEGWVDIRGDGTEIGRGIDKGGSRPAAEKLKTCEKN
jgi:hypothetical protein